MKIEEEEYDKAEKEGEEEEETIKGLHSQETDA